VGVIWRGCQAAAVFAVAFVDFFVVFVDFVVFAELEVAVFFVDAVFAVALVVDEPAFGFGVVAD
jgi:hypothetical protein